jgi:hypothetical protein
LTGAGSGWIFALLNRVGSMLAGDLAHGLHFNQMAVDLAMADRRGGPGGGSVPTAVRIQDQTTMTVDRVLLIDPASGAVVGRISRAR